MLKKKDEKKDPVEIDLELSIESYRKETNMQRTDAAYQIIDEYSRFLLPRAVDHLKQRVFVHMPMPMFELERHVEKCFTVAAAVTWNTKNIAYTGKALREGCWYIAPLNEPFKPLIRNEGQVDLSQPLELAFYFCREDNLSRLLSLQNERGVVQLVIRKHISKVAQEVFGQQTESMLIDHSFAEILKYNVVYHLVSNTDTTADEHFAFVNQMTDALDCWLRNACINLVTRTETRKEKGKYRVYFKFISLRD